MVDSPSGGVPAKAPRWDLADTEGYGGGIRFLAPVLIVWGYMCIYRRKKYGGGVHEAGGRALGGRPTLVTASFVPWSRVQVS